MDNNSITPQLNFDPNYLKQSHAFSCPSRDTSEHIVVKRHVHIEDALLIFCADCGNPLATINSNNRIIDIF